MHLFLIALAIFLAMLLCATFGFRFVKNSGAKEPEDLYHAVKTQEVPLPQDKTFPNLPEEDSTSASLLQEDVQIVTDKDDYLVLAKDGAVKLYTINQNGEQVFKQDLPISPDSLLEADRALLEKGIILESGTALATLLEDYTS